MSMDLDEAYHEVLSAFFKMRYMQEVVIAAVIGGPALLVGSQTGWNRQYMLLASVAAFAWMRLDMPFPFRKHCVKGGPPEPSAVWRGWI